MIPTAIVAYLALFGAVAIVFVLASMILGWFLRAHEPNASKKEIYECGEPSVGPGDVQFDLRFYVVALLFLVFEVEVAFFFPPATVFGTANHYRATHADGMTIAKADATKSLADASAKGTIELTPESAKTLALTAMLDLGVFFAVLLVGFAYVWRRGDLDWVRAVRHPRAALEPAHEMRLGGE
jgi:NADH-quinone oxidoreductase subunit A